MNGKRVGITGHQQIVNLDWVTQTFWGLINPDDTIVSGLANGFDQLAVELGLYKGCKITAVEAYLNSTAHWPDVYKAKYDFLTRGSEKIITSITKTKGVWSIRDRWVVNNCDVLIALYDGRPKGGTAETVNFALNKKPLILMNPVTKNVHERGQN